MVSIGHQFAFRGWSLALGLSFVAGTAQLGAESPDSAPDADPAFNLRFWSGEVELSGSIRDRVSLETLVREIRHSHAEMKIWDVDLDYNPQAVALPPMKELAGLILELALSTKDGGLRFGADAITVTGRTDSLVTQAALTTRLEELSRGRHVELRNEIQIVSTDELKEPSENRPNLVLNPKPLEETLIVVSNETYGPPERVLRAQPIGGVLSPGEIAFGEQTAGSAPKGKVADSNAILGPVAPVRFDANSFLIGFEQHDSVRDTADIIKSLPSRAAKVTLRGYPDAAGESTYHAWLATARAKQVRQLLIDFGVPEARLSVKSAKAGLKRQVQIVLPR